MQHHLNQWARALSMLSPINGAWGRLFGVWLGAWAVLGAVASGAQDGRGSQRLVLEVVDRSQWAGKAEALERLYLANSGEGWSPNGRVAERGYGLLEAGAQDKGWVFELPRSLVEAQDFAFKFTRGNWETVEVDGQGGDLENRRLGPVTWPAEGGAARLRVELLGFRDQRGSRWSAPAAGASSFSGQGELFELASKKLGDRRTIRVWLPTGYGERAERRRRYPVLYMHDGQNCFDASTSAVGQEWCLDEVLGAAIADGQLEPWIVVGIDNIGATRAADYNPTGQEVRGSVGRGGDYLDFLCDELVPEIERRYRVAKGPDRRAIGGSSFGGNISLLAMLERPGFFNRALIESPALWVGEGVLIERLKNFKGRLPERIWIAMGGREYGDPTRDQALIQRARELAAALSSSESDPAALRRLTIDPEGQHNERSWARHLPASLALVLGTTDSAPR